MKSLLVVLAFVVAGCAGTGSGDETGPAATSAAASTTSPATATTSTTTAWTVPPRGPESVPTSTTTTTTTTTTLPDYPIGLVPGHIEIPAVDVDATVVGLRLGGGDPEVPADFDDAGWYSATREPGEIGPAVIAGHIDSRSGPAVFHRLDELEAGDRIVVYSDAGEHRTFVVTATGQYPKSDLPREVFGFGDAVPELRLITCGGAFDEDAGHYEDNFVVYARAA